MEKMDLTQRRHYIYTRFMYFMCCSNGIEVVFPRPKFIGKLNKFNKHYLKHILSLPNTTAEPSVYILSGTPAIELGSLIVCIRYRAGVPDSMYMEGSAVVFGSDKICLR